MNDAKNFPPTIRRAHDQSNCSFIRAGWLMGHHPPPHHRHYTIQYITIVYAVDISVGRHAREHTSMMRSLLLQGALCSLFLLLKCQCFQVQPRLLSSSRQHPSSLMPLYATVNFNNFWISTYANYTVCDTPEREPDFESRSGSKYWEEDGSVIRQSDHWTGQHGCYKIVDCYWHINEKFDFEDIKTAKCAFPDFAKKRKKGRKTLQERGVVVREKQEKKELVKIKIDFDNFWRSTQAHYVAHDYPTDREPDFKSKSGSAYWDDGDGVIRLSDHWTGQFGVTRIVDCRWTIDVPQTQVKQPVSGKCLYEDFVKRKRKPTKTISWRKLSR
jgi:hypothetical protein